MENIIFKEYGLEILDRIGPLWEKLNQYHRNVSTNFSGDFNRFTFSQRKHMIINESEKSTFKIITAESKVNGEIIGYCISSISPNKVGKIESLYVEPAHRGHGIGDCFMKAALSWMDTNGANKKMVSTSVGNHRAEKFYQRYGFKARTTTFQQI